MSPRIPERNEHNVEGYRRFRQIDLPKYTIQIPELQHALRDVPEGCTIVDVGCGLGDITAYMAAYTRARKAIGVDSSRPMLIHARKNAPYQNLHFVQAKGGRLPLGKEVADATYSNLLLMEQSKKTHLFEAIASMAAITKRGGIVVAIISNPYTVDRMPGNALRRFHPDAYKDKKPLLDAAHEGMSIKYTLLGEENEELDSFEDYYWLAETYGQAFEDAGLEVEYQREAGYPREIVQQYHIPEEFDFAHVMAIKARKI